MLAGGVVTTVQLDDAADVSEVRDTVPCILQAWEGTTLSCLTSWMGRLGGGGGLVIDGTSHEGGHLSLTLAADLGDLRDEVFERTARVFYWVELQATIDSMTIRVDYDRPPDTEGDRHLRLPGAYVSDLEMYPRPPELVPGWMKVELAAVGAWDLVADGPRWNDRREPTGTPQSPESVGIEPPPGAEYAILPPLEPR